MHTFRAHLFTAVAATALATHGDAAADSLHMRKQPAPAPIAPAPTPAPAPPAPTSTDGTDEELAKMAAEAERAAEAGQATVGGEVIEVTGSLVDRKTLDTPAPVTVIDRELLKASGQTNVGSILQTLPAASNGVTVAFNNGGDGSTRVNLRGLGTARTLVLMNGRRIVPSGTGADSSVDLDVIPLAMVERVEVLKDGASAIYGSDAVGGVVNVITRNDFRGSEATLYTGQTSRGDGSIYDASFVTGGGNDQGNVVFSAGYSQQDAIFAGDRDFAKTARSFDFSPDTYGTITTAGSRTTPNGSVSWRDGHDADAGPGNALWQSLKTICPRAPTGTNVSATCTRDSIDGPWRPFDGGGNSDVGEGDLYNFQPENYITIPLRRYNVFSVGTYELGDHLHAEYEALYVNRKSQQSLAAEPINFSAYARPLVVSRDSIYNPFGRDVFSARRRLVEGGDRIGTQNVDTFRLVAGLRGDIPDDAPALKNWKWEASFNYGHTQGTQVDRGSYIVSHLQHAIGPSFFDASGQAVCGTPAAPIDGCIPIDLLGPANQAGITKQQLDSIAYTGIGLGSNDQKTLLAQAHGQLARTPWDGDVALAVGADYRKEEGAFQPDPLAATGNSTTNASLPVGGSFDVKEGFAELSIVPVTNRALARYLELDGAFRAYDYDTFGSGATWKASVLYKIPQGVALRGTYSTSFRAPSINDLYSGLSQSNPAGVDPCDTFFRPRTPILQKNCAADGVPDDYQNGGRQVTETVGGNPALAPETATVVTAGVVIEPPSIKGLAATVDYYRIKITSAITAIGANVLLSECYTFEVRKNCDLITRDPSTGDLLNIKDQTTNVGGQDASGVDYALSYDHDFGDVGRFRFNLDGSVLLTFDEVTEIDKIYGIGVYDLGAHPRVKTNVAARWAKGHVGAGFNVRTIAGMKECGFNDCSKQDFDPYPDATTAHHTDSNGVRGVDRSITGDVFLSFDTQDTVGTTSVAVGVNNVADSPPPFVYNGFYGNSDASTYDFVGRFVYVRMTQTF